MSRGLMYVREWMMKDVKMRLYLELRYRVELHVVLPGMLGILIVS